MFRSFLGGIEGKNGVEWKSFMGSFVLNVLSFSYIEFVSLLIRQSTFYNLYELHNYRYPMSTRIHSKIPRLSLLVIHKPRETTSNPLSPTILMYLPSKQIQSISYNANQGWCVLHTTSFTGMYEDDPPVYLNYLIENTFGQETENWIQVLNTGMGYDFGLDAVDGDPPQDARSPQAYKMAVESIGTGEIRVPELGEEQIKAQSGGGCCVVM